MIFLHLDSGRFELIPLNRTMRRSPEKPDHASYLRAAVLHRRDGGRAGRLAGLGRGPRPHGPPLQPLAQDRVPARRLPAGHPADVDRGARRLAPHSSSPTKPTLDLRALYWEHTQANLAPGQPLDRGLTNSAAITAVLNRSVDGKSGMAVRDRSTRQLGSFHQKAVVVVKSDPIPSPDGNKRHRVVAYVGGIDLAHGRWDTDEHYHLDPERQEGSGWRDVQIKLEGDAALDVLKNFTQRWQALIDFDASSPCRPANVVNNMSKPFKVPTHVRALRRTGPAGADHPDLAARELPCHACRSSPSSARTASSARSRATSRPSAGPRSSS